MPEGHTIHRLARDQNDVLSRRRLRVTSPQGRFSSEAKELDGQKLRRVEAAGKHLFYHFEAGWIPHVHLGLFGKYRTHTNPPPAPRGAVRVRFEAKQHTVDLNGPNTCELIDAEACASILARLGPDPLRDDADPERAWRRIHSGKAPIGLLLIDQSVIAGIGNIYRSELLHLVGVHPRTPGSSLTRRQFNRLWRLAVELLNLGVQHNRIITVHAKTLPKDVSKMTRGKLLRIFKKPACPACGCDVERFAQAGRKVFACPACQTSGNTGENGPHPLRRRLRKA